jgi:hypothetical protein
MQPRAIFIRVTDTIAEPALANKLASPGRLMNQGEQLHKCVIYFFPIMPSNIGAYAYVNPELPLSRLPPNGK